MSVRPNVRLMTGVLLCCLVAGTVLSARAQARGPGGGFPPPGGRGPGGPGGPPPGAPGNNAPSGPGASGTNGSTRAGLRVGPVGRWWDDRSVVRAVGLNRQQQKKMDAVFEANKPAILATYKTFLSEQAKLDALTKQIDVDTTRMFAAIDAVNQARASLEKANTQMLLQIRQQMEPEQIQRLEKWQEE